MEDSKPRWLWRRGEWALVGVVWGGWAQGLEVEPAMASRCPDGLRLSKEHSV